MGILFRFSSLLALMCCKLRFYQATCPNGNCNSVVSRQSASLAAKELTKFVRVESLTSRPLMLVGIVQHNSIEHHAMSIRTASVNSMESDLRCTSRIYIDNVTLTLHNLTPTSQKPYQHNNKCDCRKTNGYT